MGMMDILQSGPWAFYAGASPMASGANAFMQNFNQSQENERIKKIQEMQMQAQQAQMLRAQQEQAMKAQQAQNEVSFRQEAELLGESPTPEQLLALQRKYNPKEAITNQLNFIKNEEANKIKMEQFEQKMNHEIELLKLKNDNASQLQAEKLQNVLDAIKARASTPNIKGNGKPLPYQAIKAVNEEVENIGISKGIQSDLQGFVTQLDTGTLKLGPMENLKNTALNKANQSTEASRNYWSFMSNLEKLRNDSLRLNKGIQTEGDAQRAWKELLSNVTDQKFVRQRLKEIQTINERAIKLRQQKINNITKNYNKDDYDFSDIEDLPSATNLNKHQLSGKPAGKYKINGKVIKWNGTEEI